jgi:hypothetical protein
MAEGIERRDSAAHMAGSVDPVTPTSEAFEPGQRRSAARRTGTTTDRLRPHWPPRLSTLVTLGRGLVLAVVALASVAVGLLGFSAAAWITRTPAAGVAVRFDTTWYYRISQLGYLHRIPTSATDYPGLRVAFFPGLPLVERAVHHVVGGAPAHTTVLVGTAGLIVSCILLWSLVARDWSAAIAWRAVALLAFFPGAYVFPMAYSEALAIPLAIGTLWALRRRWFLVAGVAAALAGTVRLLSIMLIAACVVAAIRELREPNDGTDTRVRAVLCPILSTGGVVAYMIYLKSITGSFFAFNTAERLGWQNRVSLLAPFHDLRLFFEYGFHGAPFVIINGLGVFAVAAAIVTVLAVAMPLEYKVFGAGILAAWMFTTNSGAWMRFIEFAFPALVAVAVKLPGRILFPVLGVCGAALGILIVLFGSSIAFSP